MNDYFSVVVRRFRIVFWNIGTLFTWFSAILLFPLIFLIFYPEEIHYALGFVESAILSFIFGISMKLASNIKESPAITVQEGAVIVLFSWIFAIFFSALPFVFMKVLNFSQAIFEATSGWTTTGLTMITDVTKIPKIFLVWRSTMQFIGGAGFAVIMLAALIGPLGIGLYSAEGRIDNILPNIKQSAKTMMIIYITYAIFGFFALWIVGMHPFEAFNHSLTALATGGFSTRNGSIGEFNNLRIEIVTIILMFLGATGFGIHYTLWKGNIKVFLKNGEPWLLFSTAFLMTFLVFPQAVGLIYKSSEESFRRTFFQIVSAITGTGFSTDDLSKWNIFPLGIFVLTILMMLGGMMDSTAGGLKQFRLFVLGKVIFYTIIDFVNPKRIVRRIEVWKGENVRYVNPSMLRDMLVFFGIYFVTYFLGVFILLSYGYSLSDSMFEFSSAMNGVGLSVGLTNPNNPLGVIWTMTIGMFLGRLEFIVILYAIIRIMKDIRILISGSRG